MLLWGQSMSEWFFQACFREGRSPLTSCLSSHSTTPYFEGEDVKQVGFPLWEGGVSREFGHPSDWVLPLLPQLSVLPLWVINKFLGAQLAPYVLLTAWLELGCLLLLFALYTERFLALWQSLGVVVRNLFRQNCWFQVSPSNLDTAVATSAIIAWKKTNWCNQGTA